MPTIDQIQQILRKDKCVEIFKDVKFPGDAEVLQDTNIRNFVTYKFKRKIKQIQYNTLNMMISMKLINGPRFIESILKKIQLVKDIFVMDLEIGQETLIPRELSQDQLPYSYRYYDSILQIAQSKATDERRAFTQLKSKLSTMFDEKLSLSNTLGYGQFLAKLKGGNQKMIIKKKSKQQSEAIDHNKSQHSV